MLNHQATDTATIGVRRDDAETPLVGKRDRRRLLTKVDKRTAFGRRLAELKRLYIEALGGEAELSPIKRKRVEEAADLRATAEKARGDFMRDGVGTLNDIVRTERAARSAERALGIVERAAKAKTLADVLSGRA